MSTIQCSTGGQVGTARRAVRAVWDLIHPRRRIAGGWEPTVGGILPEGQAPSCRVIVANPAFPAGNTEVAPPVPEWRAALSERSYRPSRVWGFALACVFVLSAQAAETVTYSYDAAGRLTNAAYSGGGGIAYGYDANGNLLERVVTDDGGMETVATPGFDPDGGAQAGSSVTVTVTCATVDATIRYTTTGEDPTESSDAVASGGTVSVSVPGTLKARAWKAGMTPSAVKSADYTAAGPPAWDDGYQDLGGGWRRLNWFGDYAVMALEGWIWHNRHGFFYVAGTSTPGDVWLFANDMHWLYTGNGLYPFLYRADDGAWLWYNGAVNPRWFMNFTSGQWESRP